MSKTEQRGVFSEKEEAELLAYFGAIRSLCEAGRIAAFRSLDKLACESGQDHDVEAARTLMAATMDAALALAEAKARITLALVHRAAEAAVAAEQTRWGEAIARLTPDVDGSGVDSGDPLDVALVEIRRTQNRWSDSVYDVEPALAVEFEGPEGHARMARELLRFRHVAGVTTPSQSREGEPKCGGAG